MSTGWVELYGAGRPAEEGGGGSAEQSRRSGPGMWWWGGAPFEVCAERGGAALVGVTAPRKQEGAIKGALWGCDSWSGVG